MVITNTGVTKRNCPKGSSSFGNSGVYTKQKFVAEVFHCYSVLMATCSGDVMQQGLVEAL